MTVAGLSRGSSRSAFTGVKKSILAIRPSAGTVTPSPPLTETSVTSGSGRNVSRLWPPQSIPCRNAAANARVIAEAQSICARPLVPWTGGPVLVAAPRIERRQGGARRAHHRGPGCLVSLACSGGSRHAKPQATRPLRGHVRRPHRVVLPLLGGAEHIVPVVDMTEQRLDEAWRQALAPRDGRLSVPGIPVAHVPDRVFVRDLEEAGQVEFQFPPAVRVGGFDVENRHAPLGKAERRPQVAPRPVRLRSGEGAEDFSVIRSLISTAGKQGWDIPRTLTSPPNRLLAELRVA